MKLETVARDLRFIAAGDARDRGRSEPLSFIVAMTVFSEGISFLWDHRNATAAYVRWRLGTLYGSFTPAGEDRPMRELLRALWGDRRNVVDYLLWRRGMRVGRRS